MILKEKRKKKEIFSVLIAYFAIFFLSAYTFPQDRTPYLVVNCNFGNNLVMAFPVDQAKYISVNGTEIINTSSNTVYAYCSDSERITFPTYNTPYRSYNYQNQTALSVSDVIENHLADYSSSALFQSNSSIITVSIIGGLLLCSLLLVVKR